MRNKFSMALALSVIALSAFGVQAQTVWERTDKKSDKDRKQITVRTIRRQNGIIVATSDQVIVRPAVRTNVRPVVVRVPVAPKPPVVRTNVRVYTDGNNYSSNRTASSYTYRTYESVGDYESNRRIESGGVAHVARLNGYRDGLREGAADARDGDGYNPFGEHAYKDAATGYISKYGNREGYKQLYRQSFVKGYKESFDRYLGSSDRRNW